MQTSLSERGFTAITDWFARASGIQLAANKRPLVAGRLSKLALARGIDSLDDYVRQLLHSQDAKEVAEAVDALTTNETYFFREPKHFEFLAQQLARWPRGTPLRVWSAASSTGEEAFSAAMLLADKLGVTAAWEVVGTDLSSSVVAAAARGLYPINRIELLPPEYLRKYCLKGQGEYDGQLLIARELRAKVSFQIANLTQPLPAIGQFDVVFLRNVLIYFELAAKAGIVANVATHLKVGGFLFTGHAESLNGVPGPLAQIQPAIYRRIAGAAVSA